MYSVEELTGNNLICSSNLGNGLFHDFEQDSLLDNFKKAIKDEEFKLFAFVVCDFNSDAYLMQDIKQKWSRLNNASGNNLAVVAFSKDYTEYSRNMYQEALRNELDISLNNPSILFFTLYKENDNIVIGCKSIFTLRTLTTVNIYDVISLFNDVNMKLNDTRFDITKISTSEYNERIKKLLDNIFKEHTKVDVRISNYKLSNLANLLTLFKAI